MSQTANDLKNERTKSTFPVREMTYLLNGGKNQTERKEYFQKLCENEPVFDNKENYFLSRSERFKRSTKKFLRVQELRHQMNLSESDTWLLISNVGDDLAQTIHNLAFLPNLKSLFSEEQQRYWVPLAESYRVIGCYAQTELGHGSNVRGIETTATFIPETDEFEIHSPTLTSTKWWPGALGRVGNHAIVYARLIISGKDYGVHNFIVQIRSFDEHKPLKGMTIGDIGPKLGYNTQDNGYIRFDHVRIPRTNMAMKYITVDRNGNYSVQKKSNSKISYIGMLYLRSIIVGSAKLSLSKACTIAIRYSAVRRQGFNDATSNSEHQVLDYPLLQYRLFPLLATAYAFHFTGEAMKKHFELLASQMGQGDMSMLQEVHATSSGLKSVCTQISADGIEVCRRACGGHGYLLSSGLVELFGTYVQVCTAEGENHMIIQQTSRYLVKALDQARNGTKLPPGCSYLSQEKYLSSARCPAKSPQDLRKFDVLVEAYAHRALIQISLASKSIENYMKNQKLSFEEAFNQSQIVIYRSAYAHCMYTILVSFINAFEKIKKTENKEIYNILLILCQSFGLYWMQHDIGGFMEAGYLSQEQVEWLRDEFEKSLREIRPNAVGLVDAFGHSDHVLQSTLGRYDGEVYKALWDSAQLEPLNQRDPVDGFDESIKPLINQLYKNQSSKL